MTKTTGTAIPAPPLVDAGCASIVDRLRATIEALSDGELSA